MKCPAWFFVLSASEKMGHLNSLLHPPLAIKPSTFFPSISPSRLLSPHSFFSFFLFVPPPGGTAQSDKGTDGHFSCHFSLSFLSHRVCDCVTSWSLIDRGRGSVCVFRQGWGWRGEAGVKMMVCVCLDALCVCVWGEGVETGRSVDRMGELRGRSVRVKRRGVGLLGLEMELHTLTLSHSLWQFGSFTLSCFALFVCAPPSVSHVKMCPHCPLVPIWPLGITAVRTRAKAHNDSWAWVCRKKTRSTAEERPLLLQQLSLIAFVCLVCYLFWLHFNSVREFDRVKVQFHFFV